MINREEARKQTLQKIYEKALVMVELEINSAIDSGDFSCIVYFYKADLQYCYDIKDVETFVKSYGYQTNVVEFDDGYKLHVLW
jgi:hypothetical protein